MINYCEKLHFEFDKVKAQREEVAKEILLFKEGKSDQKKCDEAFQKLNEEIKKYEEVCKTLVKLPDGRNLWAPDYVALENLANLNKFGMKKIFLGITADGIEADTLRLAKLDLSFLKELTQLGNCLNGLSKLTRLDLYNCSGITSLGDSLNGLESLTTLELGYCTGLTSLCDSLCKLTKLEMLNLSGCQNIASLDDSLNGLSNLNKLFLTDCRMLHPEVPAIQAKLPNCDIQF